MAAFRGEYGLSAISDGDDSARAASGQNARGAGAACRRLRPRIEIHRGYAWRARLSRRTAIHRRGYPDAFRAAHRSVGSGGAAWCSGVVAATGCGMFCALSAYRQIYGGACRTPGLSTHDEDDHAERLAGDLTPHRSTRL